jgi:hypothetical protein
MTAYTLLVHNTTGTRVAVAVTPEVADVAQIAWRTAVVEPFAAVRIRWTLRYSFFAARTGRLCPGAIVRPSAQAYADPVDRNLVMLTYDSSFRFGATEEQPEAGVLIVRQDGTVPPHRGAIGVAIDGMPAAAVVGHHQRSLRRRRAAGRAAHPLRAPRALPRWGDGRPRRGVVTEELAWLCTGPYTTFCFQCVRSGMWMARGDGRPSRR